MMDDEARYDRQLRLFGAEGQKAVAATRVAIVGLGGLGSHLAQQLAYLGVRDFLMVDADRVSDSNLNRLIGAVPDDAVTDRLKVSVAKDLVLRIAPMADVRALDDVFITETGLDLLRGATVIFGAVDNDASRLILNEFSQAHDIPYIDTATDVDPAGPGPGYGGRVVVSAGGGGCLSCLGLLDQEALDVELASEAGRRQREVIYGVDTEALDTRGPSVVSVNGVVASLAVTEFMNLITGLREPRLHLSYNGSIGGVFIEEDRGPEPCYYCDGQRGRGEDVDVRRHLRNGMGERLRALMQSGSEAQ